MTYKRPEIQTMKPMEIVYHVLLREHILIQYIKQTLRRRWVLSEENQQNMVLTAVENQNVNVRIRNKEIISCKMFKNKFHPYYIQLNQVLHDADFLSLTFCQWTLGKINYNEDCFKFVLSKSAYWKSQWLIGLMEYQCLGGIIHNFCDLPIVL